MADRYPFLERIPPEKRLTAINALGTFQAHEHGTELDVSDDIHAGRYNPLGSGPTKTVIEISPEAEEEILDEADREMRQRPHSPRKNE